MKPLIFIFGILLLASCGANETAKTSANVSETDSAREERHIQEGLTDITKQLDLPLLQCLNNRLELRVWVSNWRRGESVFLLTVENNEVRSSEIHYRIHYTDSNAMRKKKDTSNPYLRIKVDSARMKTLSPAIPAQNLIDTLMNIHIAHFPQKQDFKAVQEAGTDGSGMLIEIKENNVYRYLGFRCFSYPAEDAALYNRIDDLVNFLRRNLHATEARCD